MNLHPEISSLIEEIDAFIERNGTNPTAFGKDSINDPNLYRRLKAGANPRFPTLDRIRAFMRDREGVAA